MSPNHHWTIQPPVYGSHHSHILMPPPKVCCYTLNIQATTFPLKAPTINTSCGPHFIYFHKSMDHILKIKKQWTYFHEFLNWSQNYNKYIHQLLNHAFKFNIKTITNRLIKKSITYIKLLQHHNKIDPHIKYLEYTLSIYKQHLSTLKSNSQQYPTTNHYNSLT